MSSALPELISFLDESPDPCIVMDNEYRIVAGNRAYTREFATGETLVGRRCYEVSHRIDVPCDQAGESCPLKMTRETGVAQRVLHQHHTPRGEEHVDVETRAIRDAAGEIIYFVETLHRVRQAGTRPAAQGLVGRAGRFTDMLHRMMRVADSPAAVLLQGETGTGKELVARAIHEASARRDGPFVVVDCAGLTETLFESELFGYEKGAFTGASHRKIGLVEAAHGGTLFLDEIGELPLPQQVKLLRLLETRTYRRVGGLDALPTDFRLICATHRDLRAMVEAESFRQDLFYRINTFPLHTPALHERAADIPLLAHSLLARVDRKANRRLSVEALDWLSRRRYRGNIRELRNLIEYASLLADGEVIELAHLLPSEEDGPQSTADDGPVFRVDRLIDLKTLEQRYLDWVRQHAAGRTAEVARQLGISERTLYRKARR